MIIKTLLTLIQEQKPMTREAIERRNKYLFPYQFDNDIKAAGPAIRALPDGRYVATNYYTLFSETGQGDGRDS